MKMAERNRTHTHRRADAQPVHYHPDRTEQDGTTGGSILACQRRARETEPTCHGIVLVAVIEGLRPTESPRSDSGVSDV
jgi:hypothetical protein